MSKLFHSIHSFRFNQVSLHSFFCVLLLHISVVIMLFRSYLVAAGLLCTPVVQSSTIPTNTEEVKQFDTFLAQRAAPSSCGKYYDVEKVKHLGTGTYGRVYSAKAREKKYRPSEKVALKESRYGHAQDLLDGARIAQESFRSCPNLMKVFASCKHGDESWVISELLDPTKELMKLIENGHFKRHPGEILNVGKEMMTGLAYMHSKNICYNDVKPENILLDGTVWKYVDFDLLSRGTPTHMCGTAVYASPG
jgi:hypothetical protein